MKYLLILAIAATPAVAADQPVIAPAPTWVHPESIPEDKAKPDDQPVRILLLDQQSRLEPGRESNYSAFALKIQTPQGLAAGNIALPWRPETDTLTVHRIMIRRGDQQIDVLKSQTFTVARREQNMESATLDGVLTANIQPEGLQVGDVIEMAATVTTIDPVMKGHVEQAGGAWNVPVLRAHMRVEWPATVPLRIRATGALPGPVTKTADGYKSFDVAISELKPVTPPKGAPARYNVTRLIESTDFASWADMAALFAPLYQTAAVIPPNGSLASELATIKTASTDPGMRATAALALVQNRIRYVALLMGVGGLKPANASDTWSRRYGDCKAKTALLLALLHAMDIPAVPVIVSTRLGDGMDQRMPMIGLFDHVIVRATIDGTDYWLDGTRTGDTSLDRLQVPNFRWGLPLVPKAQLVAITPKPPLQPLQDQVIRIDARGGLTAPAPIHAETVFRGDAGFGMKLAIDQLTSDQRDKTLRDYWKGQFDDVQIDAATSAFDPRTGENKLVLEGKLPMRWKNGWYETDDTSVGWKADFSRDKGEDATAPFAVNYPYFERSVETILLPKGFPDSAPVGDAVDETVAGIAYHRQSQIKDRTFTIERTARAVVAEFPAKDAPAAEARLRALADNRAYIHTPPTYQPTDAEVQATLTAVPEDNDGYVRRGNLFMDRGRYDEAIADYDKAQALDGKDVWAYADRGMAHVWKGELDVATRDLDAAAAIDPRNLVVYRAKGVMAEKKGDKPAAIAALTTALEIKPGDLFSLERRAKLYRDSSKPDLALADLDAIVKADPAQTGVRLLKANMLVAQGRRDLAKAEADALLASTKDDAYPAVAAARIYSALGQPDAAMKAFDRAINVKPEAYIYINRAETRQRRTLPADTQIIKPPSRSIPKAKTR